MALKDWKRIDYGKKYKTTFIHKLKKTAGLSHSINIIKVHNGWETLTYPYIKKYNKNFKTKSQALKFAKVYMRKH